MTKESVLDGTHENDGLWVYSASKAIAERELWKFADAHPEVDITTSKLIIALFVFVTPSDTVRSTTQSSRAWFTGQSLRASS